MICHDPSRNGEASLDFGSRLAETAHGPTTILTVVESHISLDEAQSLNEQLRPKNFSHLTNLSTKVRQGEILTKIILEAQEGHYEMIVLSRKGKVPMLSGAGFGSIARQILSHAAIPLLLVDDSRPKIERILICTAAGEPGKVDILFGGRVTRRIGAHATVLHIIRPKSSPSDVRRIERHLHQAQRYLEALGVPSECNMKGDVPMAG